MRAVPTEIAGVLILEPEVYEDDRGYFYESYNRKKFEELSDVSCEFVQDNHSLSKKGVIRGLHYQVEHSQAKLIRVTQGEVFDVAVDIRKSSPSFGRWVGVRVSAQNRRQVWIPEGFAHGYQVLTGTAEVIYKASDYYSPQHERCIRWDDPAIDVGWLGIDPVILSDKDRGGVDLESAEVFR